MSIPFLIIFASVICNQSPPSAGTQPDPTSNMGDTYSSDRSVVQPPDPPATTRPIDGLLKGPAVVETDARTLTLVHHNFDGTMQDVGPEPDYTAIGMLSLTDDQRHWYDTIHAERLATFDQCLRSNYGLILELASLQGETDPQKRLEVIEEVRTAFAEYIQRGPFHVEMKDHLTPEQREQVQNMMTEYRRARVAELRSAIGADATPQKIAQRARLESFGTMIRQSIDRLVGMERENFERLSDELDLSPEQKGKAQAIFQPLAVKRLQKIDTPEDGAKAFAEFTKILSPEQRKLALQIVARNWKPVASSSSDSKSQDGKSRPPASRPSSAGNMDNANDMDGPHDR